MCSFDLDGMAREFVAGLAPEAWMSGSSEWRVRPKPGRGSCNRTKTVRDVCHSWFRILPSQLNPSSAGDVKPFLDGRYGLAGNPSQNFFRSLIMIRLPFFFVPALMITVACAPSVDRAAEEQVIRDLDREWVAAVAAGDTLAIANFYAEDGYFMPPNAPRVDGHGAISGAWAGMLQLPNVSLTFAPTDIVIAEAGDMAYDIGTYDLGWDGPDGRIEDNGKYVIVWRKVNGDWKVMADILNSDIPAM